MATPLTFNLLTKEIILDLLDNDEDELITIIENGSLDISPFQAVLHKLLDPISETSSSEVSDEELNCLKDLELLSDEDSVIELVTPNFGSQIDPNVEYELVSNDSDDESDHEVPNIDIDTLPKILSEEELEAEKARNKSLVNFFNQNNWITPETDISYLLQNKHYKILEQLLLIMDDKNANFSLLRMSLDENNAELLEILKGIIDLSDAEDTDYLEIICFSENWFHFRDEIDEVSEDPIVQDIINRSDNDDLKEEFLLHE